MEKKLLQALQNIINAMEKEWKDNEQKYTEAEFPYSEDWAKAYAEAKEVLAQANNNLTVAHK